MELFGLDVDGEVDADSIATGVVVIVELIDEDGDKRLRVLDSDMPIWHCIGMLDTILAADRDDAARHFEED